MDADTLVRAIRAALDETERLAREATPGPWRLGVMFGTVIADDRNVARDCSEQDAEHITHNDPAAVLRRVAADRRILERHLPELGIQRAYYCRRCHVPVGDPQWPCDEIRDLCDRLDINPETETPQ